MRPSLLDPIETASRDEIIALQTRRPAATLRRAYNAVPAMRAKFDQHGVHPDDFRTLADLQRFPFTAKADFRANYPFGLLAVPKDQLARVHASSGTTGKPTVVGYFQRSRHVEQRSRANDPHRSSLKLGSFGAEPWTNAMRDELEDAFNIDALDSYGLSEVIGPGVAGECVETKDSLHIWEDHFYPEIIDPKTGAALPDGEFGEIVFTSLRKEAMPVIRYRTGDLTRLLPGTARSMRRMEKVLGEAFHDHFGTVFGVALPARGDYLHLLVLLCAR